MDLNSAFIVFLLFFCEYVFLKRYRNLKILLYYYVICAFLKYSINFNGSSNYLEFINVFNSRYNVYILYCIHVCIQSNLNRNYRVYLGVHTMLILYNDIYAFNNIYVFDILSTKTTNNTNLLNGVMLIHPPILYFFYSFSAVVLYEYFFRNTLFKKFFYLKEFYPAIVIYLILFTTALGCWWAEQELSWGGWWNWDFVEILAIIYVFNILKYLHSSDGYNYEVNMKNAKFLMAIMLVSICSVRFNLINSVHNFVASDSQNQYCYYVYAAIICCLAQLVLYEYLHDERKLYFLTNLFLFLCVISLLCELLKIVSIVFNLKYIYTYSLTVVYLIYVFHTGLSKIYLPAALFFIDNFFSCFLLSSFLSSFLGTRFEKNRKIFWMHMHTLLFMLFSLKQLFLFKSYEYLLPNQILLIKINLFNRLESFFPVYDAVTNSLVGVKSNVFNLISICDNDPTSVYKNITEKRIFLFKNSLVEFSNFDLTVLSQPFSLVLFLSLACSLFLYGYLFFLKTSTTI